MTMDSPGGPQESVTPEMVAVAREVFNSWQSGQQEPALQRLRDYVDANPEQTWALAMLCWLYQQQGEPGYRNGHQYAMRAIRAGVPWVATNFANTIVANAQAWPDLLDVGLKLAAETWPFALGFDPVGTAWNLLSVNRDEEALRVMSVPRFPYPTTDEGLRGLVDSARNHVTAIEALDQQAKSAVQGASDAAQAAKDSIEKLRGDLETQARQAKVLIDSVSAGTVNDRFESDATANEKQSTLAFRWGLAVLCLAALVTATPLVLHYFGHGPDYSSTALLAAHASATLALATVAGVLLARARNRDRARQRASDLATAMGTIIVYSNQIQDAGEKQRFMQTMGQLVLVAHLQADQTGSDQASVGLPSLLAALRTPPSS